MDTSSFPSIEFDQFERALRHYAGTDDGEFYDIAGFCAKELGVPETIVNTEEGHTWFMHQVRDRLEEIDVYSIDLEYLDCDEIANGEMIFFLLPSGAFGCWRFDSAGDSIAFIANEFNPLTIPFLLKHAFLTALGVEFNGAMCLEPVKLRFFDFRAGQSYPIDDPNFWAEVFGLSAMEREVEEFRRKSD